MRFVNDTIWIVNGNSKNPHNLLVKLRCLEAVDSIDTDGVRLRGFDSTLYVLDASGLRCKLVGAYADGKNLIRFSRLEELDVAPVVKPLPTVAKAKPVLPKKEEESRPLPTVREKVERMDEAEPFPKNPYEF